MNIELWNQGVDWIEEHPEVRSEIIQGLKLRFVSAAHRAVSIGAIAMMTRSHVLDGWDLKAQVGRLLEISPYHADSLYHSAWPASWFEKAGLGSRPRKTPNAQEAVTCILRGMAKDGEAWSDP